MEEVRERVGLGVIESVQLEQGYGLGLSLGLRAWALSRPRTEVSNLDCRSRMVVPIWACEQYRGGLRDWQGMRGGSVEREPNANHKNATRTKEACTISRAASGLPSNLV